MKILLKQGLVLSSTAPYRFKRKDILIQDGKIAEISDTISTSADEKIDCREKVILPGLINSHTHVAMNILRGVGDDLQLMDWLSKEIWPREKKLTENDVHIGSKLAICESIRSGTTCINDMYFHMDLVTDAVEESGIRAVLGYGMIDLGDFEAKGQEELKEAKRFTKKLIEKKNPLLRPAICPHAPHTCSKKLLEESAKLAKEQRQILHIHCAETRAELAHTLKEYRLRPVQLLEKTGCLTDSSILAHGVYVSKSEFRTLKKSGASIAHCPASNLKLAGGGAAPIPQFIIEDVNLSIGTDSAASNNSLSVLESAKMGALEQKNFHFDASAIKADDYLKMCLEGGARALGLRSGKIKKGYDADLIFIDKNQPNIVPFTNNAGWLLYSFTNSNVADSMVGGRWVMKDRVILTLDEAKVLKDSQKIADRLN